ncbi:DUF6338 family protein [Amycolatopsis sp. WGS_07]|uniref:DUF6338 family protein n=1 Tax=Amycolatopsis sp. WGS_07 TaxID=3076764 RepID=UPI00387353A6
MNNNVLTTWVSVLFFFIFVAPGILFDLLSERRRPGASESSFREISRTALASLVFSGTAAVLVFCVSQIFPGLFLKIEGIARRGNAYLLENLALTFRTCATLVLISLGLAILGNWLLSRRSGGANIRAINSWTQVFKNDRPEGHEAYVRVRTGFGTYYGKVANFSSGLEGDGRELVLAPPIRSAVVGKSMSAAPARFSRLIVKGDDIQSMFVEYYPKGKSPIPLKEHHPDDSSGEESGMPDEGA